MKFKMVIEGDTRPSSAQAIILQGVSKSFETEHNEIHAVDKIDLIINSGEFFTVVGPSGCGKTTLLRLIGGLVSPTTGTILVNSRPAQEARSDRQYGMVFQQPVLLDWRTTLSNVALPLEIMGVASPEREARSRDALALVGLSSFESRYPWQLSGGMQQRVAIARALVYHPTLLLMDEPFGALDAITRDALQVELSSLLDRTSATVVFITHSIPEAVFLSDRVAVMTPRPGKILEVVDVQLPRPRVKDTRGTRPFFDLVQGVRGLLEEGFRSQRDAQRD